MTPRVLPAVRLFIILVLTAPALAARIELTGAAAPGEVVVKMRPGAARADIASLERAGDVEQSDHLAVLRDGVLLRMRSRSRNTEKLIAALEKNPNVIYVEPNFILRPVATPNDPSLAQLWAMSNRLGAADISAESAWNVTTGSSDIVVGIVDTGVDYNHPDLAANMWRNPGGAGDAACAAGTFGYNALNNTCDPMDDNNHGTHVAGTIGAAGNNGIGVAGVNWTTSMMALKFMASQGGGPVSGAVRVIDFAIQAKIDGVNLRVLSNSWGGTYFSKALLDIINKAYEHDILFVAAAGNDEVDNDFSPHYPANYATPNMISVAATDNADRLAVFSNYGAQTVHLGAPGVGIYSSIIGGGYANFNGTSMAAPHVAGVAALLLAKSPSLTTDQVRSAILGNTDPIPALNGKTVTGGRLNAAKVLGAPAVPRFTITASPAAQQVPRGSSATIAIGVQKVNRFTGPVTLSLSPLPAGATATFSTTSTSTTSTLTVTTSETTPIGYMYLTITATSGSMTRTAQADVIVGHVPAPASECLSFAKGITYYAGGAGTAIGDFNRDGAPDLVSADLPGNRLYVLLGNGAGVFHTPMPYAVGVAPMHVAVADFNGDGEPDIVSANSGANNVSVLLGNGDGTFQASVHYAAGASPFFVATGDFDNDGNADLAVANNASANLSILRGIGDGTFAAAVPITAGSGPFAVSVADLDADGDDDLVVPTFNAHRVAVLLGDGDGSFAPAVQYIAGTSPSAVAIADFDRDGTLDLAVANHGSSNVSILGGNGNGTFRAPVQLVIHTGAFAVATGDFNSDGAADLITGNASDRSLTLLSGNGNGTFQTMVGYYGFLEPSHISVADLNGDGKDDVIAADGNTYRHTLVMLNTSTCAYDCGTFTAATPIAVGADPDAVATGDLNGDGRADLAIVHGGVSIKLATGDNTFGAGVTVDAGTDPDAIAVADFNRDGNLDLAVANAGSDDLSVLSGNGDGTFQAAVAHAAGSNPRAIATGDFNRDGSLDIAVANGGSDDVAVLAGGTAVFFDAGTAPSGITAADFDRDGELDLAISNNGSNDVSVLRGKGDGTFQTAASFAAGSAPSAIVSADFNRDGNLDLAVANSGSGDVSVLSGNGDGTFAAAIAFATGTAPVSLIAGDFNGDGKADLAVANSGSDNVSFLRGNGSGSFAAAVNTDAGTAPASVATADFNRDGNFDLAVANSGSSTLSILRNTCPFADLTVTKTHSGEFVQGTAGSTYTITVSNVGTGATNGPVSVTDALPVGLRATAIIGAGWACSLGTLTCTRSDVVLGGASYPPVTLTVAIAGNAAATLTNQVTVAGGGDDNAANNTASDPTTITSVTDLVSSMTHAGSFTQGATGRTYTVVVSNASGLATNGTVTVNSVLPAALTPTAISGTGWNCNLGSLTCTRNDALAANSSYPAITITVDVAANAPADVLATATVAGGGESNSANNTTSDRTLIWSSETCGGLGSPVDYSTGSGPSAIAIGHFNGDGRPDLALTNYYSHTVSVLLGRADGTFAAAVTYGAGQAPIDIALADLNGDGHRDIVTVNYNSSDVSVLFGNGDGTFRAAIAYPAGDTPHALAVGDLNQDGNADVVVSHRTASLSVLLGNGGGALQPRRAYSAATPASFLDVAVADFDGDGALDLIAPSEFGGVWKFAGNGSGTFPTSVHFAGGGLSQQVVVGDFNRDGQPDVAVPNRFDSAMSVLLASNGSFQPAASYPLNSPGDTNVVDINGDGNLDLLVMSSGGSLFHTLLGKGDGTFHPATNTTVFSINEFVMSDFNGDGKPDMAGINSYGSSVNIFLGGCSDLTITKTHTGTFTAGQNHNYSLTVTNTGRGSTQGTVTVTDVLPEGLSAVSMNGSGWTCALASVTCTRADSRAPNMSYPAITLTVKVSRTAPASLTNTATVSGGGDINPANDSASDPTTIVHLPDLMITYTHIGNFAQGQTGRTYTIAVGNIGTAETSGTVTVTAIPPTGMTATGLSGSGWTCSLASNTCTRSDALAIDGTWPPITQTVTVSTTAPQFVYAYVSVSGGGDTAPWSTNNSTNDPTNIMATPANLAASVASPSSVGLTWTAAAHAKSYRVLRSPGENGPFTIIGTPLSNNYLDASVAQNTTYFYRVQSADATNVSLESNTASVRTQGSAATRFTDDTIVSGVTVIKAVHITELRAAVNAMRVQAGLSAFTFTDASLAGAQMKAVHLTELRTALDQARAALGLPALVHTDATPRLIKAVHIRELRAGVS